MDNTYETPIKHRWKLGLWAFLMTAGTGAGGYYAWQGRACITGAAQACEKERDDLRARATDAEANLGKMQGSLSATKQELDDLRKWKNDTAKRLQTFRDM